MERSPLAHLNPTDPARLARDTAWELVRAAVAVANLCDERREGGGPLTSEQLVDDLCEVIAGRLLEMMRVFDADDLNSMILLAAEAIDHVGFGDALDMRDVWVFRRWADPGAFTHERPETGDDLEAARADLLRSGVVVLEDTRHRGARTITATGPTADAVRDALAEVDPRAVVDWAGPAPRRLRVVPCTSYRERGEDLLRVWVALEPEAHVDELVVAEDDDMVVVLPVVCTPAVTGPGLRHHVPYRVWLRAPLGDREVVDGATGLPLRPDAP